jgi:hypothetical protein
MYFIERLIFRLGIIFAMALMLRGAGAVYHVFHPVKAGVTTEIDIGGGRTATVPARLAQVSGLAASLYDTNMLTAVQIVRNSHNGDLTGGGGGLGTYRSEAGPVQISGAYIPEINSVYRRFQAQISQAGAGETASNTL